MQDAIELTEVISQRYGVKKVILVGHSWGTIIGMKAALKRPDLYYAYVGIGQVINSRLNEQLSFDYALRKARENENNVAVKKLKGIWFGNSAHPIQYEELGKTLLNLVKYVLPLTKTN